MKILLEKNPLAIILLLTFTLSCGTSKKNDLLKVFGFLFLIQSKVTVIPPVITTATRVYGQNGSFSENARNNGGISASSQLFPDYLAVDVNGGFYVSDRNNRILYYPTGSTMATKVYGQGGSFTTITYQNIISANTLINPTGLVTDSTGGLYISDGVNRVLYYPSGSTTATRVYGQIGNFTSGDPNNGGVSADSLYLPLGVTTDYKGGLYIADSSNNRVLYYPAGSTTATRVYGQNGSFTSYTRNNGGVSANSLDSPCCVATDLNEGVYISDGAFRVLYYPSGSTTATRVYGQNGKFTTQNGGTTYENRLFIPYGIATDANNGLYIADSGFNRVLYFTSGSIIPSRVYGQKGSITSITANNGGISADSLYEAKNVAVDASGRPYIADTLNNRVLYY